MTNRVETIARPAARVGRARWRWHRHAAAALAASLATACAAPAGSSGQRRPPADRVSTSHPEPDPACRATVREPLAANGLERVTVQVTVTPAGKLAVLEFLGPALNPTAAAELRAAYAGCAWKPGLTASGEPVESTAVLMFDTR